MLFSTILFTLACTVIFLARKKAGLFWSGTAFFVVTVLYLQHGIDPPAPAALVLLYA